ncbi:MAG: hypothetical protein IIC74_11590, partial [Bacteroidetes bacterium]|nr:hypothetical protein [Bacteroidota bacterium]
MQSENFRKTPEPFTDLYLKGFFFVLPYNVYIILRFIKESKDKNRICKVLNKTLSKKNKIQINLHDGSNVLTEDKIKTQDTVYLDGENKIAKHDPLEKGKPCLVISGKYLGKEG